MKSRLILSVIMLICCKVMFGQDNSNKKLHLQDRPYEMNSYYVQTIFNKLNNSSIYLQMFLTKELDLTMANDEEYNLKSGIGNITYTYINSIIHSSDEIDEEAYKVYIKYYVFIFKGEFFVEKLDIWGNWESVANIFVSYYPTEINIEHLKNNETEITSYFIEDKAVFSSQIENDKLIGKISVRSTTNMDIDSFINKYKKE